MTTLSVESQAATFDIATTGRPRPPQPRIVSIDFVRGVVMILMAIDHVRVYSGLPAGGPTPGIFFTRWITHFVAPAFVFLAGTAAYLHGRKLHGRGELSRFLFTRGAWLVVLELTLIRVAWTFNLDFAHYLLAGVIWMIGICMMLMAVAVYLPTTVAGGIGIAIVTLHNLTDLFVAPARAFGHVGPNWFLKILYYGGVVKVGNSGPRLYVLYSIVPWIGVMMAGYAFGLAIERLPERRRTISFALGIVLVTLFVLLRSLDVYGDPRHWKQSRAPLAGSERSIGTVRPANSGPAPSPGTPGVIRFLDTTKYPASLSFLLVTLGPMFILLALAEGWKGRVVDLTSTFGRVPMFYYLLHIPVIHAGACIVSVFREGHVDRWLFGNHPMAPPPVPIGYAWSLSLLYAVFAATVIVLYFPCRWFARVRQTEGSPWLSYL